MAAKANATAPRVSVITIFYNAEQYFAAAIESVLAQDFEGFELLLVDDGSSDRSTAMAKEYADRHPDRVRYLDHPGHANRGMSATRNVGFAAARGDLIAFIDSDDRWSPSKLSEQVAIMDRFPDVDLVCGAANYWRSWDGGPDELVPTGHIQNRPIPPGEATLALYPLGKAAAPCPSDIMVRRKAALALGGFEESFTGPLQMYEDQAFLAKLYLEHSVYFSDRVWLDYRIHDKSCVAEVSAGGQYDDVRQHFLRWFSDYLSEHPELRTAAIDRALRRALSPYRLPRPVGQFARAVRKVLTR